MLIWSQNQSFNYFTKLPPKHCLIFPSYWLTPLPPCPHFLSTTLSQTLHNSCRHVAGFSVWSPPPGPQEWVPSETWCGLVEKTWALAPDSPHLMPVPSASASVVMDELNVCESKFPHLENESYDSICFKMGFFLGGGLVFNAIMLVKPWAQCLAHSIRSVGSYCLVILPRRKLPCFPLLLMPFTTTDTAPSTTWLWFSLFILFVCLLTLHSPNDLLWFRRI